MGQGTLGTTTINSNALNIGTTSTGTINIGNTGTTVTANSIVNIGAGATGINIGNTGGIVNINKLRLFGNPVLTYLFSAGTSQVLSSGSAAVIKYPTAETRNGTGTGITYNSTTGTFTNSNSYSVVIVLTAGISYTLNGTGTRGIYVNHNVLGQMAFLNVIANTADYTSLCLSSIFILNSSETFEIVAYQTSTANLTISANPVNRVSVLVL